MPPLSNLGGDYLRIVMTVKSCVEPNSSLETRTVALPCPRSAPFGTVVRNVAMPFAEVVPSAVIVGIPGSTG